MLMFKNWAWCYKTPFFGAKISMIFIVANAKNMM